MRREIVFFVDFREEGKLPPSLLRMRRNLQKGAFSHILRREFGFTGFLCLVRKWETDSFLNFIFGLKYNKVLRKVCFKFIQKGNYFQVYDRNSVWGWRPAGREGGASPAWERKPEPAPVAPNSVISWPSGRVCVSVKNCKAIIYQKDVYLDRQGEGGAALFFIPEMRNIFVFKFHIWPKV